MENKKEEIIILESRKVISLEKYLRIVGQF